MHTQLLDLQHQEQLVTLLKEQKTYFGLPIEQFPASLTDWKSITALASSYLAEDNPYNRAYGAFDDQGQLVGTISADFLVDQPMWILRRICVAEGLKGNSNDIRRALMSAVILFGEERGYRQHLYLIPAKYERAHAQIWSDHPTRQGRYVASELERVPANGVSRFRLFWEYLFGRMSFPLETVIRVSTLQDGAKDVQ